MDCGYKKIHVKYFTNFKKNPTPPVEAGSRTWLGEGDVERRTRCCAAALGRIRAAMCLGDWGGDRSDVCRHPAASDGHHTPTHAMDGQKSSCCLLPKQPHDG